MNTDDDTAALLDDPTRAGTLGDTARASLLARGSLAARQRLGAARARLRAAELYGEDEAELAAIRAEIAPLQARSQAAEARFVEADAARPTGTPKGATLYGQTRPLPGQVTQSLPLTAALLGQDGALAATTEVEDDGSFVLTAEGAVSARLQLSDAAQGVVFRDAEPTDIEAGQIEYREVAISPAKPKPAPPPTILTMPDLSRQSEDVACAILARIGITEVKILDVPDSTTPGLVVAQDPAAGTVLQEGQGVSLSIGRAGDGEAVRRLPDFVGLTTALARERAVALGLETKVVLSPDAGRAPDTVVAQDPPAGTPVREIEVLSLTVTPPRETVRVEVPEVLGMESAQAIAVLRRVGLREEVSDRRLPGVTGRVIEQAPKAGTSQESGAVVTLFLGALVSPTDRLGGLVSPTDRLR